MYEPFYIPSLKNFPLQLSGARFAVHHERRFISPSEPGLDPMHIHDCTELIVYVRGSLSFSVSGQLYSLKKGDIVISRRNELHVGVFQEAEEYEYFCVWIDDDEHSPLLNFLKTLDMPVLSFDVETQEKMYALLSSVASLDESPLQQTADFLQFLTLLQRTNKQAEQGRTIPQSLQIILNDIHKNAADIPHAQDLSKRYFISNATLDRWFKKYLHVSPRAFLESEKLALSSKLLLNGASVTEACMHSGFSDCSYFISLFKRKFGETPLRYKNREK